MRTFFIVQELRRFWHLLYQWQLKITTNSSNYTSFIDT